MPGIVPVDGVEAASRGGAAVLWVLGEGHGSLHSIPGTSTDTAPAFSQGTNTDTAPAFSQGTGMDLFSPL